MLKMLCLNKEPRKGPAYNSSAHGGQRPGRFRGPLNIGLL